jgi:hypothetical protein
MNYHFIASTGFLAAGAFGLTVIVGTIREGARDIRRTLARWDALEDEKALYERLRGERRLIDRETMK